MNQWKTLIRTSQVKKNDAVRMTSITNAGKRWIYIVEKVASDEIHLSGGEDYPSFKVIYQEDLDEGNYEYVNLNKPERE